MFVLNGFFVNHSKPSVSVAQVISPIACASDFGQDQQTKVQEPPVPSAYIPFVAKARQIMAAEGINGPFIYQNSYPIQVSSEEVIQVNLVDSASFPHHIFLRSKDKVQLFSPWDNEARRIEARLPGLGFKAPFQLTGVPLSWLELTGKTFGASFSDSEFSRFSIEVSLPNEKIISISIDPGINRSIEQFKPSDKEISLGEESLRKLGVVAADLQQANRDRDRGDIEFYCMIPKKRYPFQAQLFTSLWLDPKTHKVIDFITPTAEELAKTETIPEIDQEYLEAAKSIDPAIGPTRGRRFARATVVIGTAAWSPPVSQETLGWINSEHTRITSLDGVEYPVERFLKYDLFASAEIPPVSTIRNRNFICQISSVTPALLLNSGDAEQAKRLYHYLTNKRPASLATSIADSLSYRYRMLIADSLKRNAIKESLRWSQFLCLVENQRVNVVEKSPYAEKNQRTKDFAEAYALRADLQRRLVQQREIHESDGVTALIEGLDQLTTSQSSQPGGIDFHSDPLVVSLIKKGTTAVPKLIDAIGTDARYTRAISFGRDFWEQRYFHSTREVEFLALRQIWPSMPIIDQSNPAEAVSNLRGAWKHQSSLSEPERMLEILKATKSDLWLSAGGYFANAKTDPIFKKSHLEEIENLLKKDVVELEPSSQPSGTDVFQMDKALVLAHDLAVWAGKDSLESLRSTSTAAVRLAQSYKQLEYLATPTISANFGRLVGDRIRFSDSTVDTDIRKMLDMTNVDGFSFQAAFWKPLWESKPDSPTRIVLDDFFDHLSDHSKKNEYLLEEFLLSGCWSGLLTLRSFRIELVKTIENDSTYGEVSLDNDGRATCSAKNTSRIVIIPSGSTFSIPFGTKMAVSIGDNFCSYLSSRIVGSPILSLCSSAEDRKRAIADMKEFLMDEKRDWLAVAKRSPFFRDTN